MELPIRARRLFITEFDEGMAHSVHANSLDDDNRRFLPDEVFETVGQARDIVSKLISHYSQNDAPLVYPIMLNNGRHIGHVQAIPVENAWEIGFHVAKAFAGYGYATEAVDAFLPPIMRRLGLSQIFGVCRADNAASRRVLEKCGFLLDFEGDGLIHGERRLICRYKHFAPVQWCAKTPAPSLRAAESGVAIQTPNPFNSPVIVFPQSGSPRRFASRDDGGGD